jgi:hypothetical protein
MSRIRTRGPSVQGFKYCTHFALRCHRGWHNVLFLEYCQDDEIKKIEMNSHAAVVVRRKVFIILVRKY